jgi:hypothetical protein
VQEDELALAALEEEIDRRRRQAGLQVLRGGERTRSSWPVHTDTAYVTVDTFDVDHNSVRSLILRTSSALQEEEAERIMDLMDDAGASELSYERWRAFSHEERTVLDPSQISINPFRDSSMGASDYAETELWLRSMLTQQAHELSFAVPSQALGFRLAPPPFLHITRELQLLAHACVESLVALAARRRGSPAPSLPRSDMYIIDALIVCKDLEGSFEHGEAAALVALVRLHGGFDDEHVFLRSRNPHSALWEAGFTVAQTCHVASAWEQLVYNLHFKMSDGRRSAGAEDDDEQLTEELEWRCQMELEQRRSAAAREQSELEELHTLAVVRASPMPLASFVDDMLAPAGATSPFGASPFVPPRLPPLGSTSSSFSRGRSATTPSSSRSRGSAHTLDVSSSTSRRTELDTSSTTSRRSDRRGVGRGGAGGGGGGGDDGSDHGSATSSRSSRRSRSSSRLRPPPTPAPLPPWTFTTAFHAQNMRVVKWVVKLKDFLTTFGLQELVESYKVTVLPSEKFLFDHHLEYFSADGARHLLNHFPAQRSSRCWSRWCWRRRWRR